MRTIDECKHFYNTDVSAMIRDKFPDYERQIAVGVAGEGSDCFGYDDEISRDHDFGIGVCLWLTDDDFADIGTELDAEYRHLVNGTDQGTRLEQRRGAIRISDFYNNLLGFTFDTQTPELTGGQWFYADDKNLAAAVNGEVFRDDLGRFTAVRDMLKSHYPDRIFRMKLANSLHGFAGSAQANYPRCMARRDYVAARSCLDQGIREVMQILFLINKKYMPYYKWSYRALKDLAEQSDSESCKQITEIMRLIEELSVMGINADVWESYHYDPTLINWSDENVKRVESIAEITANILYEKGLTQTKGSFLEVQSLEINRSLEDNRV